MLPADHVQPPSAVEPHLPAARSGSHRSMSRRTRFHASMPDAWSITRSTSERPHRSRCPRRLSMIVTEDAPRLLRVSVRRQRERCAPDADQAAGGSTRAKSASPVNVLEPGACCGNCLAHAVVAHQAISVRCRLLFPSRRSTQSPGASRGGCEHLGRQRAEPVLCTAARRPVTADERKGSRRHLSCWTFWRAGHPGRRTLLAGGSYAERLLGNSSGDHSSRPLG